MSFNFEECKKEISVIEAETAEEKMSRVIDIMEREFKKFGQSSFELITLVPQPNNLTEVRRIYELYQSFEPFTSLLKILNELTPEQMEEAEHAVRYTKLKNELTGLHKKANSIFGHEFDP